MQKQRKQEGGKHFVSVLCAAAILARTKHFCSFLLNHLRMLQRPLTFSPWRTVWVHGALNVQNSLAFQLTPS